MKKTISQVFLAMLCLNTIQVHASSSQAWEAYEKEVIAACLKSSDLAHPAPAGRIIHYDDTVGFDALMVRGMIKKQPTLMLCLFDKKNHTAHLADAGQLMRE